MKHFTTLMATLAAVLVIVLVIVAVVTLNGKMAQSQKNLDDAQTLVNQLVEPAVDKVKPSPNDKTTFNVNIPSKDVKQQVTIKK